MIHQPQSLLSLARNTIVKSLEDFIIKHQPLAIPVKIINAIINQAIHTLATKSVIPKKIWNRAPCTEINIQRTVSVKNIQILCTLWRETIETLCITRGNFAKTTFTGESFKKLRILKIDNPENLQKQRLLDLCELLPRNLEQLTITQCYTFDNDVLDALIEKCPHLQLLNISGCRQVSTIQKPLKQLTALDISGTKIEDTVLSTLEKERLLYFNCSNTSISNVGLQIIETSCGKTLQNLNIENCPYISCLRDGFTNLAILSTYRTPISILSCPDIMLQLPNSDGIPLLHTAIQFNNKQLINDILEKITRDEKAHILQIQDAVGNTALHWACKTKQEDLALSLIEKMDSETIGLQGQYKRTALHWAIEKGLNKVVAILIEKISSHALAAQADNGNTALHWACYTEQEDLALSLIEKMDLETIGLQGQYKRTALHWAIEKGLNKVVTILIEKMPSHMLSAQDTNENTALHLICYEKQEELALKLIKKMDTKALGLQGASKKTALYWASKNGLNQVISSLEKLSLF